MPFIHPSAEAELYECMQEKCADLSCKLLAVGGVEDHVHLLVQLHYTASVSELVKRIKGATSRLMKKRNDKFQWQSGYGVFSLDRRGLPTVSAYIANQKHHHGVGHVWDEVESFDPIGK